MRIKSNKLYYKNKNHREIKKQPMFVKPILFLLEYGMTFGDLKPLAILAVHAAHAASKVSNIAFKNNKYVSVTIACYDFKFANHLDSIRKFAEYMIGPNYSDWINIRDTSKLDYHEELKHEFEFMIFTTSQFDIRGQKILLDFGDNASINRFTSKILHYRQDSNFFGSLFLPIEPDVFWSQPNAMQELSMFVNSKPQKRVLTIAGSLKMPFNILEILDWIDNIAEQNIQNKWIIVLVGYNQAIVQHKLQRHIRKNRNLIHALMQPIEYEDLTKFSDFFVSNCGAGSVIAPILNNCPQLCMISMSMGSDKSSNKEIVGSELKLGPDDKTKKMKLNFEEFMIDIDQNYDEYLSNTKTTQFILSEETEEMALHMFEFFSDLFLGNLDQTFIEETGIIPTQYSLN
jgi:hypothetical protein